MDAMSTVSSSGHSTNIDANGNLLSLYNVKSEFTLDSENPIRIGSMARDHCWHNVQPKWMMRFDYARSDIDSEEEKAAHPVMNILHDQEDGTKNCLKGTWFNSMWPPMQGYNVVNPNSTLSDDVNNERSIARFIKKPALIKAVLANNINVVLTLLELSASPDIADLEYGITAIGWAARKGRKLSSK